MSLERALALMHLMNELNLTVLELEQAGFSLQLRAADGRGGAGHPAQAVAHPTSTDSRTTVAAAMSGIVHLSAEPRGVPLCKVGDVLGRGSLLCLLEAMKVLTRVEAPADVRIVAVCATNGAEVSEGDALFVVEAVEERNVQDDTRREPR